MALADFELLATTADERLKEMRRRAAQSATQTRARR